MQVLLVRQVEDTAVLIEKYVSHVISWNFCSCSVIRESYEN